MNDDLAAQVSGLQDAIVSSARRVPLPDRFTWEPGPAASQVTIGDTVTDRTVTIGLCDYHGARTVLAALFPGGDEEELDAALSAADQAVDDYFGALTALHVAARGYRRPPAVWWLADGPGQVRWGPYTQADCRDLWEAGHRPARQVWHGPDRAGARRCWPGWAEPPEDITGNDGELMFGEAARVYLRAVRAAGPAVTAPWRTARCPDCGRVVAGDGFVPAADGAAGHVLAGGSVIFGCEGLMTVSPAVLGLDPGSWQDWRGDLDG